MIQNQCTEVYCLLYTDNERSEREIKETIPFTIITKIIKHLGINLPKEAKDLYSENYKTLIKDIKMTQTGGEIHHILGWVNMTFITQSNLQMQCNPYQIISDIFHRIKTKNFTICMEIQKILKATVKLLKANSQSNCEQEK